MGQSVRAASLHRGVSRSFAKDWTRAVRFCLIAVACLAQLWGTAQHSHALGIASQSALFATSASGSGLTAAGSGADQSSVPCAHHASPRDGNGPSPSENCPCCGGLCCCSFIDAALGILPQETVRAEYAPLISKTAAPAAFAGFHAQFAGFAGQPRAPPSLI